jgi:hypothetical protein
MMRESGDPVLQRCAEYERAVDVVAGLAWQYFKKDWEDVAARGFHEHPLFRDRIVGKITRLANRRREPRPASRTVRLQGGGWPRVAWRALRCVCACRLPGQGWVAAADRPLPPGARFPGCAP